MPEVFQGNLTGSFQELKAMWGGGSSGYFISAANCIGQLRWDYTHSVLKENKLPFEFLLLFKCLLLPNEVHP